MKSIKLVGLALLLFALVAKEHQHIPLFFELPIQINEAFESNQIGELMEEGFIEPISIELTTSSGRPLFYESAIRTTVCDDEICEIMYIKLYWDLVGEYVGYDTIAMHPLTKFDHEPFTTNDYKKLHELLSNNGSILKFKQKSELIDKEKIKASDVVDGTTGATALEIKDEVVEGALYSSYTLWHLAYSGKVKNLISNNTEVVYDSLLKSKFISSQRHGYELFAIQRLEYKDYIKETCVWINFLKNNTPLARKIILLGIPQVLWEKEYIQNELVAVFPDLDVNSRTIYLNKLQNISIIYPSSIDELSNHISLMNKNQTKNFVQLISDYELMEESVIYNLKSAVIDPNYAYGYLIEEYLINHER